MKVLSTGVLLLYAVLFIISSCAPKTPDRLLVFSKTEGFRHASIPAGIKSIQSMGVENGFEVVTTEDASMFTTKELKNFNAVVFLNTTGDVLNPSQEQEFKRFIQAGGGFVGIHAAADTEYDWPWYGELVGAYFNGHPNDPNVRTASIEKTEHKHICTDHLPQRWERTDEWYNFKSISPHITSLLNLDETSYEGGTNGDNHPIAWIHEFDGGRAFFSGGGHTDESYEEEAFKQHLLAGIQWAMSGTKKLDYGLSSVLPEQNRFVKEELDNYFNEPMELDLLPDGRIVFVERKGAIKVHDPKLKQTRQVAMVDVYSGQEDGLMGLAVDPNYSDNQRIYLCYSAPDEIEQRISRFSFDPDDEENALREETVILTVGTQRDECCHSAGSLEFDHDGYLWASFGDDTNPHQSSGYAPIDERANRQPFDAQRTSANTADLRGSIIRIKVEEDGSYSIPDGNLFAKDGSEGRPEIYVMGCRNPFRYSIDAETGFLYWGEVGPDGREDGEERGPMGYDEVNQAKAPGFFGWPYFIGDNKVYYDYDFAAEKSGLAFDPNRPSNISPNNTGAKELPAAQKALIWYPYGKSEDFPLVGSGGRNAMAGPVYRADRYTAASKFPEYYDGKLLIYDWMRGWMMSVTLDENGDYVSMERFLPDVKWNNLMDVVMSPEGDLYTLEYGTGWFTANENAILSHLRYIPGNREPTATFEVDEIAGALPFQVTFDGSGSQDADDEPLQFTWDFGDGNSAKGESITHTYTTPGEYIATLTVKDRDGANSTHQTKILAGNAPPQVSIALASNQDFYFPTQGVSYSVEAQDHEDGLIADGDIAVTVDYLEMGYDMTSIAQGHMALSEMKSSHPGIEAISKSDCVSCHKLDGASIGPSYSAISEKYKDQGSRRIKKYLSEKIIGGGGGVWGETAMAAHPDLPAKDVDAMASYIVSLARTTPKVEIPASGTEMLAVPKGKKEGGQFVIMASYTDKGAEGVESMHTVENVVLRSPNMSAVEYAETDKATKMTVTPDMVPGLTEKMDLLIGADDSWVKYGPYDLTGVASMVLIGSAPKPYMSGGSIMVYLDDLDSDPIFETELETTAAFGQFSPMPIPLPEVDGSHEVFITFKSNQPGSPVGSFTNLIFTPAPAS
ncbi:MAG: ThuA domain-containing protein [Bacteroidota bacterium]